MQTPMFHPQTATTVDDPIAARLLAIARGLLVLGFGLLPIFFLPLPLAPFVYSKVLLIVGVVSVALVLFALATLRLGELRLEWSLGLATLWGVVLMNVLAAVFSGDVYDSFIGDTFGVHSVAFVLLLALVATATTILKDSKTSIIRLFALISLSTLVLGLFHVVRIVFGVEWLNFGVFTSPVSSLIGSWNDLALFFGVAILLALVAVEQLPLTRIGRVALFLVTVLSLAMLIVVNFSAVWFVLGGVSLVMLLYSLTKHRFTETRLAVEANKESFTTIALSALVFVVATVFIIGGGALGAAVSNTTNISYIEVRPSFSATLDIAGSVYQENAFVGIGPNKFVDAWRLYKNPAINQTAFWDTNFDAGNGYITTSLVTTGIFGTLAWILFLGVLVVSGIRMLVFGGHSDRMWYFIATASFVASVYLWGMALIYVPSVTSLVLAAVCTGIMYSAYGKLRPQPSFVLSMVTHKRVGFVLVALGVMIIVGSVSTLYFVGRHYGALYTFNAAQQAIIEGASLETVEQLMASAFAVTESDRFAREVADFQIARLSALVGQTEPREADQESFQQAAVTGVNAAELAVSRDASEPRNWQTLGQLYSVLGVAGVDGAADRAREAFNRAEALHPSSPVYPLLRAQVESRRNDIVAARSEAEVAIARKRDFTDALLFLTQLDIAEGNVTEAIARTEAVVRLEPQNPARYYQLGILYSANTDVTNAIRAFERAVALDPNYANARYFLALGLAEVGRTDEAIAQLEQVQALNPEEASLPALIEQIRSGAGVAPAADTSVITDPATVQTEAEGVVTTSTDPDTNLVTPVNPVPVESTESEAPATVGQETNPSETE